MNKFWLGLVGVCAITASAFFAIAAEDEAAVKAAIRAKIQAAIPQLPITKISVSQLAGFYEVELANGERLFATPQADHFIAGDLFRVEQDKIVNLSELQRDRVRADKLAVIDDSDKIVFTPAYKKASITVFTDVDCGYCRRLHMQMADYLERGIEIKYLAFPRAGVGSDAYNKIVSAWCADDKKEAITRLKQGQNIERRSCVNPVAEQYQLGQELGVTGTPALVFESGRLVPGYIEPERLAQLLGI